MPQWINEHLAFLPWWVAVGLVALVTIAAAVLVHAAAFGLLRRFARSSESRSDNIVVRKLAQPSRWAMIILALVAVSSIFPVLHEIWDRIGGVVMPLFIGWMVLAILHALVEVAILRNDDSMADNRRARRRRTKLALFNRIATFIIVFVVIGLMLLAIPGVRDIGVTLVASAGLAGLAVGAAAQPALKSLIAGVQMALTEPVIVGDAVIIAGEWGWIEEIRTTYVVVKVWDERRLVVPTSKFLDETFQNWTKTTAQLMGTIMLYVDPVTRLDPIRTKFEELVESNARWDGRVKHMQVTELTRDAIEVRFLVTAKDSPTLYDLRCDIREALIQWLAAEMPEAIVRSRLAPVAPLDITGFPSGEALQQMAR
ncbi:mechanosensitive ion channel family protein [Qipengyuania sp. GH1]|uniref:mechanosensitive ion channel family protein n=1 Tax=Qipengyuania aestuarii TaxID=2867241 RepID=UPI001C88A145|nr:mechanosensitive ion channel family protein [Qipengyuania aestuarii]MBX7534707.1 mechanosensitive ion channel family protein [Qipengyuania aestuarii]